MENNEIYNNNSAMLTDAVLNAERLLNFATEKGLDLDKEWIATVINAKRCEENNKWDTEAEINFWMAYKGLSKIAQPVSVSSLKATERTQITNPNFFQKFLKQKKRISFSRRSVRLYSLLALSFLLLTLALQILSVRGSTLLNKIQTNTERIREISNRKDEIFIMLQADSDNRRAELEKYRLEAEEVMLDREIKGSIELLDNWVHLIRDMVIFGAKNDKEKVTKQTENINISENTPPIPHEDGNPVSEMYDNISVIQEAQNFTQILQLYVLPLLYGLIGGFVFVLRGLWYDIRQKIFSYYSNIKYSLRIHLGALAGLIVGLLWGDIEQQQITFIESLSTAGFAFIAGYGIEYVFEGIDKVVMSISKTEKK